MIDCACGDGLGAEIFLKQNPLQLYGFDVDSESVKRATQNLACSNACFKQTDALSLPLENKCADLFISLETIEHINNDGEFVSEIARVLKPDGRLIISTPNRLVTNPGKQISEAPWNKYHVREYTAPDLAALLEKHFVINGWFGQNPVSSAKVKLMSQAAVLLGKMSAVRFNQLWKCRWFLKGSPLYHAVVEVSDRFEYEYLTVVCQRKAQA